MTESIAGVHPDRPCEREELFALLSCRSGADRKVEKNVLRSTTLIGSAERCNIRLMSDEIEPAHAVLCFDQKEFRLWDLRSRYGVLVNGQRISHARLADGDIVRVGAFEFVFRTNFVSPLKKGVFLDDYKILGLLGTGGMGWLYRAEHSKTGQQFALKVLTRKGDNRGINDGELKTRFQFEAKISGKLNHPHLIRAHAFQQRSDLDYIVMDLVEAITLQELVERDKKVRYPLACEIIRQTAEALHFIHQHGPIHRDVKPANVLIERDGNVRLCDFGLVFLGDDPLEKVLAQRLGGDCLGTADFISPEQSYNSYQIDPRADLYSLGCTLYYALSGRIPFPARNNLDKLKGHRSLQAEDLAQFVPGLPVELKSLIEQAMQKDPTQRFASLEEFARALAPFCSAGPVEFDFDKLMQLRMRQARARLVDPARVHHLERIPPSIVTQVMGSEESGPEREESPKASVLREPIREPFAGTAAAPASPEDTVPSGASPDDFVRNLPEELRQVIRRWKELPDSARQEIVQLTETASQLLGDDSR